MFPLGLVSVSFRALSPREIVALCVASGLTHLEWGADVHVPPNNISRAREVGETTRDAGLKVLCYGSYYRCDQSDFAPVLEAAVALDAPRIRVWAGTSEDDDFERVLDDLLRISSLAKTQKREVVVEFHGGTLTFNGSNARRLLDAGRGAFSSLWQPLRRAVDDEQIKENLEELRLVAPFVKHIHAYEWRETLSGKQSLSLDNSAQWPRYIKELRLLKLQVPLMLEFVPNDDPKVLEREAVALRMLCQSED